ncbi:acyl carrier protein [Colwellia chukchiensis]|uniref:Acyl carrier protein n=1 Tax=Colwellia chukchiensis TaxID=641665 RepID=A0A1H7GQ94_9GAMM|nr:phosphopantetheine-binding protein [Colwellia chukchiensis]SEK40278.1 acyl carrier protein [Colwellia chukchiensis]
MQSIEEKLQSIFSDYTEQDIELVANAQSLDEIGIDSLSIVEIIFDIEEAFDIKIPDESVLQKQGYSFSNYRDILTLVSDLVKQEHENV